MGYRILVKLRRGRGELPTPALIALSLTVAVLTFAAEAIGIAIVFNAPPLAVLEADFDVDVSLDMVRPGWLVLAAGLAISVLNLICARMARPKPQQRRPAPRQEPAAEPARALVG